MDLHKPEVVGDLHVFHGGEGLSLALSPVPLQGQVVGAQNHVLGGNGQGFPAGRGEDVQGGQDQLPGLHLGLDGEGNVNGHLVAVEVGVEGGADEGVDLKGFALHEDGLEGLDAVPMESGRPVEEDRMVLDRLFQAFPDLGGPLFDHLLGSGDGGVVLVLQEVDDEGFEELQGHDPGETALVELDVGVDHDDATSGVVHAFAQEVLTETAVLALEGVRKGLEGPVVGGQVLAPMGSVLQKGVHGLLEHPLLVLDDDLGSVLVDELAKPGVPVQDSPVELVKVGGGEGSALQLHQGTKVGREDGQNLENHPLRTVFGIQEGLQGPQPLGEFEFLLEGVFRLQAPPQLFHLFLGVDLAEKFLNGLGAHADAEIGVRELLEKLFQIRLGEDILLVDGALRLTGVEDDVPFEVDDPFQILLIEVQNQGDLAPRAAQVPDVGDRADQVDVAHPLASHLGFGHFDAALLADDPLVFFSLVFSAEALEILLGPEDLGAEEAVLLGLMGSIVNGLGLLDFSVRPLEDLFLRGKGDPHVVEGVNAHAPYAKIFLGNHFPSFSRTGSYSTSMLTFSSISGCSPWMYLCPLLFLRSSTLMARLINSRIRTLNASGRLGE